MEGNTFLAGRLLRLVLEKFQLLGFGRELFKYFLIFTEIFFRFVWFWVHDLSWFTVIPQF